MKCIVGFGTIRITNDKFSEFIFIERHLHTVLKKIRRTFKHNIYVELVHRLNLSDQLQDK